MRNKVIIPTILFVVVLIFSSVALWQAKDKNQPNGKISNSQITLFYGDGCPHCEIVDKYILENKVEKRVSFAKKEVYNNTENQKELIEKAKICNIPLDNIGVPFLWSGQNCLIGDQDIINFFKINE